MSTAATTRDYYDALTGRLLRDYVHGNPRTEAAIGMVVQRIPASAKCVLDIGCGIGWSSAEIKGHLSDAVVFGVDLSPKLIETATRLFGVTGLQFAVKDITNVSSLCPDTMDAVVLVDCYEHIPKPDRAHVHRLLNQILSPHGTILLTFPSHLHQAHLRANAPDRLQPVDEDVALDDILRLAHDLRGEIVHYQHVNIWNTNDYVHAVIQREPTFIPHNHPAACPSCAVTLEPTAQRRQRVVAQLSVQVSEDGVVTPAQQRSKRLLRTFLSRARTQV